MINKIRVAEVRDAEAFVAIKNQLPITRADGSTTTGGFLLGTDLETYKTYITQGYCLVAEVNNQVVGFGIMFTDKMLRESDVWQRRHLATWNIALSDYENRNLCYFEQLAFLSGHRRLALALAYNLVKQTFDKGYHTLVATTVKAPVLNLAAIPFIQAAGGLHTGNINEVYPTIGLINSDIYMLDANRFYTHAARHVLYPFFRQHTIGAS